ncbi:MAG: TolC family protein [Coraliomargaritaceae bacterium]
MRFLKPHWMLAAAVAIPVTGYASTEDAVVFDGEGASLVDYLRFAQSANPQLAAFDQRYQAATQRIPQASALPEPMFQITSFVESVQTRTGPQENVFMFSQKIPWFGKLGSREEVASAQAEALWYAYQTQQLSVARQLSLAFFEYAYTKEAIRLTKENRDLLNTLEPVVQAKVEGGADLNGLLRLKVEIGRVDDQLQSLSQRRIAQSSQIAKLLGVTDPALLPWPAWSPPEVIELDGVSLVGAIKANNPELEMLRRKINSAEARREIANLERYPDFSLGVNYVQIGDPGTSVADAGKDAWGVTFAVNIPIWFEKYSSARAEALASQRASENELTNRFNELRADLSASMALMNDTHRRLKLYGEELLSLAKQAVENSRTSYEAGRTGILEVIDSERSLLELQLLYWRAAADAWQQRIIVQTLTNQPLMGTFQATQEHE